MKFSSCILKVTSFCNLNCTYCYMFNQSDKTFETVPKRMSDATLDKVMERIIDYAAVRDDRRFNLIVHGGEPMLWGKSGFARLADHVDAARRRGVMIDVGVQSNFYKAPEDEILASLKKMGASISVSLDGPAAANDTNRITLGGRGSYDRVLANTEALLNGPYSALFGGFLSVADPSIAPVAFLDWLRTLPLTKIDTLLPLEVNWDAPPWRSEGRSEAAYAEAPTYGRWLTALFDAWFAADDPSVEIRLFDNVIRLLIGGTDHLDTLVHDKLDMFVVNTDGRVEPHDYLRNEEGGCRSLGRNLTVDRVDDLHGVKMLAELLALSERLPRACGECPVVALCGGGMVSGRIEQGRFTASRRSALCYDHLAFLSHVAAVVRPSESLRASS